MARFGETKTASGYRLLNDKVRVIQGDGITRDSLRDILAELDRRKLAVGNIAFGMGAGLLQKVDRDSYSYAMKASAAAMPEVIWMCRTARCAGRVDGVRPIRSKSKEMPAAKPACRMRP